VTLSLRACLIIVCLGSAAAGAPGLAQLPAAAEPRAAGDAAQGLSRRIERLLPAMLNSLAAARREREPAMIRCFDRAVSELHSLARQVTYHLERRASASLPTERERHQRALVFLAQRVDELAHSGESCFTDGVWLASGETRVEVVFAPR
jgi:hypothetical protein